MNDLNKVCVNIAQNFSEAQKAQARANIGAAAEGSGGTASVEMIAVADVPTRFNSIDEILLSLSQGKYIVLYYTTGNTVYRYYTPHSCDLRSNGTREMFFISTTSNNAKNNGCSSDATFWIRLYQSGEGQPVTVYNSSESRIYVRPDTALSNMVSIGRLSVGTTYNVGDIFGGPTSSSNADWTFYRCTSTFTADSATYIYNDTTHWVQVKLADEIQRRVPGATVSDAGKVLTVDSNGDSVWQTPSSAGYGTYNVDWSNPYTHTFTVTQEDINRGYFDGVLEFATQADVTIDILTATRVALGWDVWWAGGASNERISSVDFSIGASVDTVWQGLFSDNAPAHAFHKDWTLIPGYLVHTRYNRIRMRCNLTASAEVGDVFQIEVTGLVEQQR